MSRCECYAILTDPDRKKLFGGIFPEDKIPITPTEGTASDPMTGNPYDFWLIDNSRLTEEQRGRIAVQATKKFNITITEALEAFADGIPVKKEGAEFHFCKNHLRYGKDVFRDVSFF